MNQDTAAQRDAFLASAGQTFQVMGILNVTPDSFSDGGRFESTDAALAQADAMVAAGAAIIDLGGESTRPGFTPISAEDELARVMPVIRALVSRCPVPLSVDTTKAAVARQVLGLGVAAINDIWGLQGDPGMAAVVAAGGAAAIVMHNRHDKDEALDIVDDMRRFFDRSLAIALRAGIPRQHIVLDPGIGFGKTPRQQRAAIAGLGRLMDYGLPVLIGLSRKSFLGRITGTAPDNRLIETIAANLAAAEAGARVFRVHDVAEHVAALKVFEAIRSSSTP